MQTRLSATPVWQFRLLYYINCKNYILKYILIKHTTKDVIAKILHNYSFLYYYNFSVTVIKIIWIIHDLFKITKSYRLNLSSIVLYFLLWYFIIFLLSIFWVYFYAKKIINNDFVNFPSILKAIGIKNGYIRYLIYRRICRISANNIWLKNVCNTKQNGLIFYFTTHIWNQVYYFLIDTVYAI